MRTLDEVLNYGERCAKQTLLDDGDMIPTVYIETSEKNILIPLLQFPSTAPGRRQLFQFIGSKLRKEFPSQKRVVVLFAHLGYRWLEDRQAGTSGPRQEVLILSASDEKETAIRLLQVIRTGGQVDVSPDPLMNEVAPLSPRAIQDHNLEALFASYRATNKVPCN